MIPFRGTWNADRAILAAAAIAQEVNRNSRGAKNVAQAEFLGGCVHLLNIEGIENTCLSETASKTKNYV